MGNKINPVGFRLGVNKQPSAHWYASAKDYPKLLAEDERIRQVVRQDVGHSGISRIDIERAAHNVNVTIHTAKPGVVIGRGGESIKSLRTKLGQFIAGNVAVNVQEVPNPNTNGALIAQRIAEQLERRFAFRRAMKQAVQRTMESGAQGVKIRCSGRLGGAEQARPEWYSDGRVPLQTLRADIDYGFYEAKTTFGRIGVKVWIYKGEVAGTRAERQAQAAARAGAPSRGRGGARGGDRPTRGSRGDRPTRADRAPQTDAPTDSTAPLATQQEPAAAEPSKEG